MNPVLNNYIPTARLIAETFGNRCEVVLHDLTTPEHSVVYTCGGSVTNRAVGQSFSHLVSEVLLSEDFEGDRVVNYPIVGIRGKKVKSSTSLIRDTDGRVVGALCVNVDITAESAMLNQLSDFCRVSPPPGGKRPVEESVEVVGNVREIVDDIIDKTIGSYDTETMNRDEKVKLVRFLSEKGIFLIKGSVDKVAERMHVSPVTVYSYLDGVSKNK